MREDPEVGTCQLYPPVVVPTKFFATSLWPEVHASRTCGLWEEPHDDSDDPAREDLPEQSAEIIQIRDAA